MTVRVTCWRLFHNGRGFEDYERESRCDRRFGTAEEAVDYMHDMAGWDSIGERLTFSVEIEGRGWDE